MQNRYSGLWRRALLHHQVPAANAPKVSPWAWDTKKNCSLECTTNVYLTCCCSTSSALIIVPDWYACHVFFSICNCFQTTSICGFVPKRIQEGEMGTTASYLRGTPGPSGFGSASTAEDVTAGLDLSSKTIIVTGATSGIGKESARVLAKRGAHVILAVRNVKLGEDFCDEIRKETPTARVDVMRLDLNSLTSVREFAANYKSRNLPLNVLLNNAGLLCMSFRLSEDDIEQSFAVNHLGHFLLTNLLLDTIKATAKECEEEGRIVNVSSFGHTMSYKPDNLDKINDPKRFVGFKAYGQSKLAQILHAKELARRLQEEGANVTVNALHPGTMDTGFGKSETSFKILLGVFFAVGGKFVKSTPQGAATQCYVATNPNLKGVSGKYFIDCNEHLPEDAAAACNMELAATYWKFSEELIASKNTKINEAS